MTVDYWTPSGTHNYVAEFIENQSVNDQKKIFRDLELIEKYGLHFANLKKLRPYNMHEIKIRSYRFFCAFRGSTCWLLHAFIKKSNRTPQRELMTGLSRMRELDKYLAVSLA